MFSFIRVEKISKQSMYFNFYSYKIRPHRPAEVLIWGIRGFNQGIVSFYLLEGMSKKSFIEDFFEVTQTTLMYK